jgi:tRNA 2-selenouridine synthase
MSSWNDPELRKIFLKDTPLIDVRAPIEFKAGQIPHSINLPIINDEERHLIGTCYKEQGQEAAIELGHKLVSSDIKSQRIAAWMDYLQKNPSAEVFCFRGGLRSQLSCASLTEAGIKRTPISGGYKRMRNFFLSQLNDAPLPKIIRLGGLTGSGKTKILRTLPHYIDLEELAHHRGSAFGIMGEQPSQVTFENHISLGLMKNPERVIVEDESATIGKLTVPTKLYQSMISSPMVVLKVSLNERVKNIFDDYVHLRNAEFSVNALQSIHKRLGKAKTQTLTEEIQKAFLRGPVLEHHADWIATLLKDYYDPFYQKSLNRQKELILFEGDQNGVAQFLVS